MSVTRAVLVVLKHLIFIESADVAQNLFLNYNKKTTIICLTTLFNIRWYLQKSTLIRKVRFRQPRQEVRYRNAFYFTSTHESFK